MADKSLKKVMSGVDQVARDIQARDSKDVDVVRRKTAAFKTSHGNVPAYPKDHGKPISDSEIMGAAEAAERLHKNKDMFGGLGERAYNALQSRAAEVRAKLKVPNPNDNKGK